MQQSLHAETSGLRPPTGAIRVSFSTRISTVRFKCPSWTIDRSNALAQVDVGSSAHSRSSKASTLVSTTLIKKPTRIPHCSCRAVRCDRHPVRHHVRVLVHEALQTKEAEHLEDSEDPEHLQHAQRRPGALHQPVVFSFCKSASRAESRRARKSQKQTISVARALAARERRKRRVFRRKRGRRFGHPTPLWHAPRNLYLCPKSRARGAANSL